MKAENFGKARDSVQKSVGEIDGFHQKFKKETWESHKELELLIDLDRISEIK